MKKPNWADAPEWAQWLSMDFGGDWYWHEYEPYGAGTEWCSDGAMRFAGNFGHPCEARPK